MLYRSQKKEPLVSRFDLGKILRQTSLIHCGCYVARNLTEKNLLGNDSESPISEGNFDNRLNGSDDHQLMINSSAAVGSEASLGIPSSSVDTIHLLPMVHPALNNDCGEMRYERYEGQQSDQHPPFSGRQHRVWNSSSCRGTVAKSVGARPCAFCKGGY